MMILTSKKRQNAPLAKDGLILRVITADIVIRAVTAKSAENAALPVEKYAQIVVRVARIALKWQMMGTASHVQTASITVVRTMQGLKITGTTGDNFKLRQNHRPVSTTV